MKLQNERVLSWKNIPCILTALFGGFVSIVGGILAIYEIIHGLDCSHGVEPSYCHSGVAPPTGNHTNWSTGKSSVLTKYWTLLYEWFYWSLWKCKTQLIWSNFGRIFVFNINVVWILRWNSAFPFCWSEVGTIEVRSILWGMEINVVK